MNGPTDVKSNNEVNAFTLAEVLITLGIIGIVAAMTIPVLMSKYRENLVVTRMQKFYSTFNQALQQSEIENGTMDNWTLGDMYDSASNLVFYEKYLKNYLRVLKIEDRVDTLPVVGEKLYFADGSAVTVAGGWLVYAPVAEKTKEYGRDLFIFLLNPRYATSSQGCRGRMNPFACHWDRVTIRTHALEGCTDTAKPPAQRRACSTLIMQDGWKIESDYPVKF